VDPLVEKFSAAFEADVEARIARAERAAWLARLGWPESGWVFHSEGTVQPWAELRRTFIDGCYLATILVGQSFLENLLAGQLAFARQKSVGRPHLAAVLEAVRDRGWLTPDEFATLDSLRKMRNPYAHYRHFNDPESLISRATTTETAPETLLEHDARALIEALYHLVNRPPFALGPIIYPLDDEPAVHPDQMHLPL
jgi:hypothetical protein